MMHRITRTFVSQAVVTLAFVSLALVGAPLAAQSISSSFDEVIDVEVVNLDVYVTDKKGRAVHGLARGDFQLYVDGEPVEITNFYAVEDGRRAEGGLASTEPLTLVVYVDNVHLGQFTRNRLIQELRPFLKERHQDGDQIMIASYDGRVRMRQSFTREWGEVASALDRVSKEEGLGHLTETAHQRVIDNLLLQSDNQRYLAGHGRTNLPKTQCPVEMREVAKNYAEMVQYRVAGSVESLGAVVGTLANLPGRKALLHVSDGLPLQPGAEVFEFLSQFCGDAGGQSIEHGKFQSETGGPELLADDRGGAGHQEGCAAGEQYGDAYQAEQVQLDASRFNNGSLFEQLAFKANASRVTLFAFDAYGPRGFSGSSAKVDRRRATSRRVDEVRRASLQDSLSTMAERTGGQAILDTHQFASALKKVGQDFESYYSLGYRLAMGSEGRSMDVRVEVERPGVRPRYRKSLRSRSLSEDLAGRTQAALLYGLVDNPLGIVVRPGSSLPMDDGMQLVPIQVRIPIGKITLIPDSSDYLGQLTLFLTGRDQEGKTTVVRSVPVPIRVPAAELETARARVYGYEVKMLMRPGKHTVAVGVHDDHASVASFAIEDLVVEAEAMALISGR